MIKKILIKPPPGITFTQSIDGTITFNYTLENSMILRDILINSANILINELVHELELKRAKEDEDRKIPLSPSQVIANELRRLKEENKIIEPRDALEKLLDK